MSITFNFHGLGQYYTKGFVCCAVTSTAFIMFSDYVDYSLLLICRGNDVSHLEAHFMGRSHSPLPSGVVDNFKRMLGEYGIDVSSYRQVFHDGSCGH